jgi:hypothetical protein
MNATQILIILQNDPRLFKLWREVELMENIRDEQVGRRSPDTEKSLKALEKFTLPIIEHFINALNDEDKWVRYLAADALGNLGDMRAIAHLNPLRSDKDPYLRFVSGQSLSKIAYLREILTDSRRMGCDTCLVRYIAEEVLVERNRNAVSMN